MRENKFIIGIDPGLKGGIAILSLDRLKSHVHKMPIMANGMDICAAATILDDIEKTGQIALVVIEKVIPMPQQSSTSSMTMGVNYGMLTSMLRLRRLSYQEIQPAIWKKSMGLKLAKPNKKEDAENDIDPIDTDSKKKSKATNKKAIKELAIREASKLFPQHVFKKTDDGIAEALLIAEFGRRTLVGV